MLKVIQGDTLNLTITIEKGAELIEELWFSCKALNISQRLSKISDNQYLLSFTSDVTFKCEKQYVLYDITAILKENQISTVVYNDEIVVLRKGNTIDIKIDVPTINLPEKEITPTKEKQEITYDEEYENLVKVTGKVTINPIPDEYIIPSGELEITENGNYDVTNYKNANVNVPIPEGYIKPEGEVEIVESGTYDVTNYASANVNISGGNDEFSKSLIERSITELVIPDGIDSIGQNSFYGYFALEKLLIPNGVKSIEMSAFNNCTNLKEVIFEENSQLTTIGRSAFYACKALESITIPNSVTTIETEAFRSCSGLKEVFFEGNIRNIRLNAFLSCSSLNRIRLTSTTPPSIQTGVLVSSLTTIEVPMEAVETYKAATNWSAYADLIVGY